MSGQAETNPAAGSGFTPPAGYVLVPKDVYDLLVKQAQAPAAATPVVSAKKEEQPIYLKVLRPFHLGDIKANLSPEEVLEWVPNKYVSVRGRQYNQLGSFLILWNKTWEGSHHYDPNLPPYFEVTNPAALEQLRSNRSKLPRAESEDQRIHREESRGDAARPRQTDPEFATTPQPRADNLPPRGSQERRDLIAARPAERLLAKSGTHDGSDMGVRDFQVAVTPDDQRVVASINGPPAEAAELLPLEEGGTKTTIQQRQRRLRR